MIKFEGDYSFIDVQTITEWDSLSAQNILKVQIQGNPNLLTMQAEIQQLKNDFVAIKQQLEKERTLRENNPGLQELYDRYQLMLSLVDSTSDNEY